MGHDTHLAIEVREPGEMAEQLHSEPDATKTPRGTTGDETSPITPIDTGVGGPVPSFTSDEARHNPDSVPGTQTIWESEASLYCPRSGAPHIMLQETVEGPQADRRMRTCFRCGQDLLMRPRTTVASPVSEAGSKFSASTSDSRSDYGDETGISYGIQYLLSDGRFEKRESWKGPFHLESVRRESLQVQKERLLTFDTVLVLSKPLERRGRYDDDILDVKNPRMEFWLHSTQAVVLSQKFIGALRGLVSYYPTVNLEVPELKLNEPYSILAHHLDDLENLKFSRNPANHVSSSSEISQQEQNNSIAPEVCDDGTYQHIDEILKVLKEKVWKNSICEEKARYSQTPPVCTFPMLWLLYKPGETVYAEADGKLAAYVIGSVKADRSSLRVPPHEQKALRLSLWYLDYTGKYIRRHERTVVIAPFAGERQIAALNVVPCRIVDDADSGKTKRMLEEEGRRWYSLLQVAQVRYTGETLDNVRKWIDERVIVDCASYSEERAARNDYSDYDSRSDSNDSDSDGGIRIRRGRRPVRRRGRRRRARSSDGPMLIEDVGVTFGPCPCEECRGLRRHVPHNFKWAQYDLIDPTKEESLELQDSPEGPLHRYLLCSRRLEGFRLKTRRWVTLDVANCRDPDIDKTAIDNLVMNRDQKDMIKALVHRYATGEPVGPRQPGNWNADFIESKGEGRIFLLHGSPGVGKTYTAECIAEFTGRPLLSLTCGDLGNDETELEIQLSRWFGFAERWGAVMLLDEADVYTERREFTDMRRNSMVSVFLRCMEYYRGILFLTTNRVGVFDDAFVSRIHVVLHYADLDETHRRQIWEQFFDKLAKEKRKDIYVTKRAKDYVFENPEIREIKWNGREIRNAFQTAVALAEFEHAKRDDKEPGERAELRPDHLEQVCDVALRFKDYLKEVHGLDENQRAAMDRLRARNIQKRSLP